MSERRHSKAMMESRNPARRAVDAWANGTCPRAKPCMRIGPALPKRWGRTAPREPRPTTASTKAAARRHARHAHPATTRAGHRHRTSVRLSIRQFTPASRPAQQTSPDAPSCPNPRPRPGASSSKPSGHVDRSNARARSDSSSTTRGGARFGVWQLPAREAVHIGIGPALPKRLGQQRAAECGHHRQHRDSSLAPHTPRPTRDSADRPSPSHQRPR